MISADDRNAKSYFSGLSDYLRKNGISVNNLQVDTYSLRDFFSEGDVTLSTVYKAKGNEGYMVYILGIDALYVNPDVRSRNKIFTAMTRAKAWLKITGMGRSAEFFKAELDQAKAHCPQLTFTYPSEQELKVMRRDLKASEAMSIDRALDELQQELPIEEFREALEKRLGNLDKSRGKGAARVRNPNSRTRKIPKK